MNGTSTTDDDAFDRWVSALRTTVAGEGLALTEEDEAAMRAEWRHRPQRRRPPPVARPFLTLDDLPRIYGIERLIRQLPADVLALALAGAASAVIDHVAAAMPARRFSLLRDAIAAVAGSPAEAIAAAREQVAAEAAALAARGEIVVSEPLDGGPGDAFVE